MPTFAAHLVVFVLEAPTLPREDVDVGDRVTLLLVEPIGDGVLGERD